MATRIRRAGLMVGLALVMATALAGVAWAANIQCPNDRDRTGFFTCMGTNNNDVLYGTNKADTIGGGYHGADTLYGYGGDDYLVGGSGPDKVYGGLGDDDITNQETDYHFGRDENHGGPGNDNIYGNTRSEKHYGGAGNDYITDSQSSKNPDVFRCGPGRDVVSYNKGLDKVADDCEIR